MKKLFFVGMMFTALALTSCKKDYSCTYHNSSQFIADQSITHKDVSAKQARDLKKACKEHNGTWKAK